MSIALGGALDDAGIRLPQFAVATSGEFLIRLGACNVRVGMVLHNIIRDGLTLRARHPEESVNAR
ncbi:hypothetical protein [Streptomyces fulvoviolaceus]|uniref:hypothetical protein n=1 Tax=Streptomyces fulvoviolaceus TaxID=285535 RepID=UPI0004CBB575|nr:hypothetical protein [Streptomyces fulvoviolaceus]